MVNQEGHIVVVSGCPKVQTINALVDPPAQPYWKGVQSLTSEDRDYLVRMSLRNFSLLTNSVSRS